MLIMKGQVNPQQIQLNSACKDKPLSDVVKGNKKREQQCLFAIHRHDWNCPTNNIYSERMLKLTEGKWLRKTSVVQLGREYVWLASSMRVWAPMWQHCTKPLLSSSYFSHNEKCFLYWAYIVVIPCVTESAGILSLVPLSISVFVSTCSSCWLPVKQTRLLRCFVSWRSAKA